MFSVKLANDHLHWKWFFTWLSLVMSSLVTCFVLYFSLELSWIRSGTELSQLLRIFFYLLLKYICDLDAIIKLNILYVGYSLNEQMEFLQVCIDIS